MEIRPLFLSGLNWVQFVCKFYLHHRKYSIHLLGKQYLRFLHTMLIMKEHTKKSHSFDLFEYYRHEISNNVVCPTSKGSDQPAHTHSLIRAFVSCLNILSVQLLREHHLDFLSLKEGCTSSSESTHVKMPHCWKSHLAAHIWFNGVRSAIPAASQLSGEGKGTDVDETPAH